MYSLLLETYIKDPQEKSRLFHAIDNIPAIQRKAEWAMKWIQRQALPCLHSHPHVEVMFHRCFCHKYQHLQSSPVKSDAEVICCSSNCFAERLVAFAAVEGIFFSGRYSSCCSCACFTKVLTCLPKCADHFSKPTLTYASNSDQSTAAIQLLQYLLAEEEGIHAWAHLLQRAHQQG